MLLAKEGQDVQGFLDAHSEVLPAGRVNVLRVSGGELRVAELRRRVAEFGKDWTGDLVVVTNHPELVVEKALVLPIISMDRLRDSLEAILVLQTQA